ncbi:MAG: hypothetical protein ACKOYC_08005, partial [Bacteroidota bacterium]
FLLHVIATGLLIIAAWNSISHTPFQQILSEKRAAFISLAKEEQAHSLFNTEPLHTQFPAIVLEAGEGLVNSITEPMKFGSQLLITISSVENLLILITILLLCFRIFRSNQRRGSMVLALSLAFAVSYLMVAGMVTPVAGALVRYKSIVLPLLIGPLLILANLHIGSSDWKRYFEKR